MENNLEKNIEKEIDEIWEKELKDSISKKMAPFLEKKFIEINEAISALEKKSIKNVNKYLNLVKEDDLRAKMNKHCRNLSYSDNENYLVNAVITALLNIEPLIFFFLREEKDEDLSIKISKLENNVFSLFKELFNNVWLEKEGKVEIKKIHELLSKLNKTKYNSNNPGKILSFILLKLDEELLFGKNEENKLKRNIKYLDKEDFDQIILNNKTVISENFFINYKINKECENCSKEYYVNMTFYSQKPLINLYLTKDVISSNKTKNNSNSLEGKLTLLLDSNKKKEELCEVCEKKQKFKTQNFLEEIKNDIIIINLNKEKDKKECCISFPKIFQIEETKPASYELISVLSKNNNVLEKKKNKERYSVYCKNLFDEYWYEYTDENIKIIENEDRVLNSEIALLLIYKKI